MTMPLRKHKTQARGQVLYLGQILSGILLIGESAEEPTSTAATAKGRGSRVKPAWTI